MMNVMQKLSVTRDPEKEQTNEQKPLQWGVTKIVKFSGNRINKHRLNPELNILF